MSKLLSIGVLFALLAGSAFGAQTWTGKISDSKCGAKHMSGGEHAGTPMSDHDCTIACVKGGAKYVFVSKGKIYPIENQDLAALEEHAGHTVKLTGDMQSQGSIKVTDVQMVGGAKKKKAA
jgi:hypothetical protein